MIKEVTDGPLKNKARDHFDSLFSTGDKNVPTKD